MERKRIKPELHVVPKDPHTRARIIRKEVTEPNQRIFRRILAENPELLERYHEIASEKPWQRKLNPSVPYNEELGDFICDEVATGKSLKTVCEQDGMPTMQGVMHWCTINPVFAGKYASACINKAMVWADEIMDIADDSRNDYVEQEDKDGHLQTVFDGEHMKRTTLRVDTRKWYLSKIMPKQFGDATLLKLADADGRRLPTQAPTLNIIGISPHRKRDNQEDDEE
jgi:hypothetical protein